MRTRLAGTAVLVAVLLAGATAWLAAPGASPSLNARVDDVASGLRCPTCTAVSVSTSNSPMAQSMREQIRRQLRAGRSPEQVRTWFAERYGSQVLLDPEPQGLGMVLWVVPVTALVAGVAVFVVARRRPVAPEVADRAAVRAAISPGRVAVAGVVVLAIGAVVPAALWEPGGAETAASTTPSASATQARMSAREWISVAASLERQGAYGAASDAYRKALRRRPASPAVRTRLAFVLVRDGRAEEALPLVRRLAGEPGPHRREALLVLGLAQRAASRPQSGATLRHFLSLAPDHPAAGQVRRLLRGGG